MATEEKSLFNQGYRARLLWVEKSAAVDILTPQGKPYRIDCLDKTCTCEGYHWKQRCKHTSGLIQLLVDIAALYAEERRALPPIRVTAQERELLHKGFDPFHLPKDGERVKIWIQMIGLEEIEWQYIALAANLKGCDWCLPARFVCPEEEEPE